MKALDSSLDLEALNERSVRTSLPRANPPPLPRDNWQLERDLRAAERMVRQVGTRRIDPGQNARHSAVSAPLIQNSPSAWHLSSTIPRAGTRERSAAEADEKTASRPRRSSWLAWLSLSAGLTTFACGAVLLVWSLVTDRKDLWNVGLPLALVGQAGLVLGLVLQLDGLWQSNRDTSETLENLDGKLGELRHATTLLSTTHSAPSPVLFTLTSPKEQAQNYCWPISKVSSICSR